MDNGGPTEASRVVRAYRTLACNIVPRGTSLPSKYEHAATYFSLMLHAVMQLANVVTSFVADDDGYYTKERNAGFDPDVFIIDITASAASQDVMAVPPVQFWKTYVSHVLRGVAGNPDGATGLYFAALQLHAAAMGPMARRLLRFLRESGATGVLIHVLRAQLLAIAGEPEHGTVASYTSSDHATSARPDIYAAKTADVLEAARVRHIPLADIQHSQMFAGPLFVLCEDAQVVLQEVLSHITAMAGRRVSAVILAAAEAAGSRSIFDPDDDKAIIDASHVHWLLTLLTLSKTLDGLRRHADPEYLQDELLTAMQAQGKSV